MLAEVFKYITFLINQSNNVMLSQEDKTKIKERLLSKFSLEKIILFGSQARGTANSKSDVDLLIISKTDKDRFSLMSQMTKELLTLDYAFDVIVLSENEFERDRNIPGTVARYAVKEGIVLYGH
jgi:predicted nucleotidyltransferase